MDFKKKFALIAAGSLISVGGLYAVTTSASAAPSSAPVVASPTSGVEAPVVGDTDNLQEGDQSATDSATEVANEGVSDGVDV
ncbi:MAG: hypothetical protein HY050_02230, partial [Actinobacteria bacterium]|nr:hypothetical protein [Actinomycetota bacterium]